MKAIESAALSGGKQHRNLLPGEDFAAYERLRAELVARYAPQSLLDEMEVQHLLDTLWEISRLVRMKPQVLNIDRKRALSELLRSLLFSSPFVREADFQESDRLASAYFADDTERSKIDEFLSRYGLNSDAVTAKAFARNVDTLEAIERQLQVAMGRAYAMQTHLEMTAFENGVGKNPKASKRLAAPKT